MPGRKEVALVNQALAQMASVPCGCGKRPKATHVVPLTDPKVRLRAYPEMPDSVLFSVSLKGQCQVCSQVHPFTSVRVFPREVAADLGLVPESR